MVGRLDPKGAFAEFRGAGGGTTSSKDGRVAFTGGGNNAVALSVLDAPGGAVWPITSIGTMANPSSAADP
jgi:hypothetical protein